MKKVVTKHGHEWLLPETVGEFQNAGVNLDTLCMYAGQYLRTLMGVRSTSAHTDGVKWNPSITGIRGMQNSKEDRAKEKITKIAAKLTPEQRAALLAELTKDDKNA